MLLVPKMDHLYSSRVDFLKVGHTAWTIESSQISEKKQTHDDKLE
jgi:hypothetical protein